MPTPVLPTRPLRRPLSAIENYRSLRDLRLPLDQLNVITGANGTGKSSLYRACDCWLTAARVGSSPQWPVKAGSSRPFGPGLSDLGSAAVRSGQHPVQGTVRSAADQSADSGFASDDFSYLIDLAYRLETSRRLSIWILRSNAKWSGAGRSCDPLAC